MDGIFESSLFTALRFEEKDYESYIQSVTDILAEYSWVYNVRNIDIFLYNVLEKIPNEWVDVLSKFSMKGRDLPFGYLEDDWPESLKLFITQCSELAEPRFPSKTFQNTIVNTLEEHPVLKKTSDKKQYEIKTMSHLVHKVSQAVQSNKVLDIGSGLGYLNVALHKYYSICSIGLDSVPKFTSKAKERLNKTLCNNSIHYETLEVKNTETCLLNLKAILENGKDMFCCCNSDVVSKDQRQSSSVIMIGLHSCGNLNQDMMKLFCKLDEISAFICVGCCYNKIDTTDFPMSKTAMLAMNKTNTKFPSWQPCISGLRLAAHGTRSNPAGYPVSKEATKYLFYRALVEYFVKKENIVWRQPKRHVRNPELESFSIYCSVMFEGHDLSKDEGRLKKLNVLYEEKVHLYNRIEILLVLQMMLQPLWETLVTIDRVMYFRERNIYAEVLALWEDSFSSRNLALCAYKS